MSVDEYEFSALLYLTRHGDHFEGGRLIFHDGDADRRIEPTAESAISRALPPLTSGRARGTKRKDFF